MNNTEYEEEKQAKELYKKLSSVFATSSPATKISVEGSGMQWNCFVYRGDRRCVIDCFGQTGYAISFETNMVTNAMGRTLIEEEVISAADSWLQGHDLNDLYVTFEYIDQNKRFLERLWMGALKSYPELEQCAEMRLEQRYNDIYELWISAKDHSCHIYFIGEEKIPYIKFYWDECDLFELQVRETIPLPLILKRWLCDFTPPSDLEKEFNWLDTGKLAKYYDAGRGIEGEFILSWDVVEQFYGGMYRTLYKPAQSPSILKLIAQMRENGYDKTLRAGVQLYALILSRSRRYGLRDDQLCIAFEFSDNAMNVYIKLDGENKNISCQNIEYTSQINDLLKKLEAQDIT